MKDTAEETKEPLGIKMKMDQNENLSRREEQNSYLGLTLPRIRRLGLTLEMPNEGTAATILAKGQEEIIRNWTRNRPTKIITRYRSV